MHPHSWRSIIFRAFFLIMLVYCPIQWAYAADDAFPPGTQNVTIPPVSGVRSELLQKITSIIENSIADGNYPGAVILASHHGKTIYRGVFGSQSITPQITPMRFDTIFDIASLTKVVATAPAIMQLVEKGKLQLDAPASRYWPAFGKHGKGDITIRELLTHTSGLPGDICVKEHCGTLNVLQHIVDLPLTHSAGTDFVYSDLNFIVLAHIVEIVSGESFATYTQNHIFKPLGMKDTFFRPSANLRNRIAPTTFVNKELRWGEVQDPLASAMGGVAGNAGLFSDARDLGIYAQCLVNNGRIKSDDGKKRYLLSPLTILKMTTPQSPPDILDVRGLGWDIDSVYSNRGVLFPTRSYGHTGWTGTSMWIDPLTQTWVIILTSRAHPKPHANNELANDRRIIADIVAASITDVNINTTKVKNTHLGELVRAYKTKPTTGSNHQ